MSDVLPAGRSYDEREVALILKRAVELQEGSGDAPHRLTLDEVQQIAREAGIGASHVVRAAEALEVPLRSGGPSLLGAPTTLQTTLTLEREITDNELGDLLDALRTSLGVQGQTSHGLDTVEWRGRDALGSYALSASRRGGRTRIHLGTQREEEAVVVVTTTGVAGLIATITAGTVLGPLGALGTWLAVGGGLVGTVGAARTIWQRVARRREARLRDLITRFRAALPEAMTAPR
jgi:hypothetical protein